MTFENLLSQLVKEEATPGDMLRAFRKREGFTLKDIEVITGIRESNLSAIENDRIGMTQHYAEVFAAALNVHPTVFLYPNGEFKKNAEIVRIEKKRQQHIKRKSS
jgi:transcriptional regulator with XRE-family HTH domain